MGSFRNKNSHPLDLIDQGNSNKLIMDSMLGGKAFLHDVVMDGINVNFELVPCIHDISVK
jgi:hypothetical protein